mgnify:CR=1 FL=1
MNNEIVIFNDGDINIEVQVSPEQETVWLTQKQIADVFGVEKEKGKPEGILSAVYQNVFGTEVSPSKRRLPIFCIF